MALLHFDAHLDTWDTYFDEPITHGTMFRRAFEEGLLIEDKSMHVGIRGPVYDQDDFLRASHEFGFRDHPLHASTRSACRRPLRGGA